MRVSRRSMPKAVAVAGFALCSGLSAKDEPEPVNPTASPAAVEVLRYIYEVRDQGKVLSAQHVYLQDDYDETRHIHKLTGKHPAIAEFDLLGFRESPEKKSKYIDFATKWSAAGGLVAVSWHETSPELQVLDEGGYATGTKKKMAQAVFDKVVTPGTELHGKWIEHVDHAAKWLGELQDAGIVVLWRPYHEMTGGWFWWGAKEPESFRRLWANTYERLTVHHKLNNLLWVWSAAKAGDNYTRYLSIDYVDIGGVDMYLGTRTDPQFVARAAMARKAARGKPYALTEVGCMPTLDILLNKTGFVWFEIWGKGWLDNEHWGKPKSNGPGNAPAWVKEIYAHPKVISREDLPF